jgi:hypothetical protein
MDAAAWLAEFARREQVWRDERQALWDRLGAEQRRVQDELSHVAMPVVLTPGHEIEVDDEAVPRSARAVAKAGIAAGWAVRVVASSAAVASVGVVSTVTVRARRHDERLWAAWNRDGFDTAWYVGPGGLERLGGQRLATLAKSAMTRANKAGVEVKAPEVRGVLDVIEGVRGPKQWVDLLERQEMDRAVGLISAAFPGLQLTRQ